ncbi:restriction endonuclease subunit S [Empedobacter falsenii]|uniref:restriction endonuclease subunit S n=1 Tax=Empedobacter falsenii TaxID=343874 RepID=UPI002578204A|nr:restriction endonuclease subunit S [Empedobacter falsenii]MDM1549456.1 restriction endonuclease subunit S [Empedobacter falsenii]
MEKLLQSKLRFPEFEGKLESKKIKSISNNISSGRSKKVNFNSKINLFGSTGLIGFSESADYSGEKILIARVGANAGFLYKVNGKYGVTDNTLILDILNENIDFVLNYLIKYNLNKLVFGSGQPLITGGILKKIDIKLPSIEEQQKIADYLSTIDKKLTLLEEKKTELSRFKKAMMQKLFSQEIRFKDENGNDFSDWEEKRLGEVTKIIGGGTPDTNNINYWKGTIPWISSSDIIENNIHNVNITRYINLEALNNSATKLIPKGSLLIVSRVGVGKLAIAKEDICTSQDFSNLIIKEEKINDQFLAYQFLNNRKIFYKISQGTSIKGFTSDDLKSIKINLPSLPEQQKIANFLSEIDESIDKVNEQIKETQRFKKAMLQQMFV